MKTITKEEYFKISEELTRGDFQGVLEAKERKGELTNEEVEEILAYCDNKRKV